MRPLILIALSLILTACSSPSNSTRAMPSAAECAVAVPGHSRLVLFGDSQAEGLVSQVDGCKFSFGYVMADTLGLNIINKAASGSSLLTAGWDGPSQQDAIEATQFESTDTVFFMAGYNDISEFGADPAHLALFETALTALVTSMASETSRVIIATPFRMLNYAGTQGSSAVYDTYHDAIIQVVTALALSNVSLIDTDLFFTPKAQDLEPDEIHLTAYAQTELAGLFLNAGVTL